MNNAETTYDLINGFNPIFNRISLTELRYLLDYQTPISVKSWCKRHNINIHKDGGKNYIFAYEYNRVNNEQLIKDLKQKYGSRWEEAFEYAKKGELYKMDLPKDPQSIHSIPRYKPKGKHAKLFLNKNG